MAQKQIPIRLLPTWSFICETVIADIRTKRMSYINQFDDVRYQGAPEKFDSEHKLIPLALHLVLSWNWSNESLPTDKIQRDSPNAATVRFVNPEGSLLVTEHNVPFVQTRANQQGFFGAIKVVNFPVLGWGKYTITVTPEGHESSVHQTNLTLQRTDVDQQN